MYVYTVCIIQPLLTYLHSHEMGKIYIRIGKISSMKWIYAIQNILFAKYPCAKKGHKNFLYANLLHCIMHILEFVLFSTIGIHYVRMSFSKTRSLRFGPDFTRLSRLTQRKSQLFHRARPIESVVSLADCAHHIVD